MTQVAAWHDTFFCPSIYSVSAMSANDAIPCVGRSLSPRAQMQRDTSASGWMRERDRVRERDGAGGSL
jgi:hypothetical protein